MWKDPTRSSEEVSSMRQHCIWGSLLQHRITHCILLRGFAESWLMAVTRCHVVFLYRSSCVEIILHAEFMSTQLRGQRSMSYQTRHCGPNQSCSTKAEVRLRTLFGLFEIPSAKPQGYRICWGRMSHSASNCLTLTRDMVRTKEDAITHEPTFSILDKRSRR